MANTALQDLPPITRAKRATRFVVPRAARNWLRSPPASVRWFWDALKFLFGARDVIEMRSGWSLTCHPSVYRCAYYAQKNDPEQIAEFDGFINHLPSGLVFLDIGAHFGLFSLAALHYGGPTARAVAIDPSPVAVKLLNTQARLNQSADRLTVIQASVADHSGWQDMVAVGVLASGYYVPPPQEHPESELTKTESVTLDGIVDQLGIVPTHIKIDVEGREAAVLRGGQRTFSENSAPLLFLEIHNQIVKSLGEDPQETLLLLKNYGYETFTSNDGPITDDEILNEPLIRIIARKRIID